LGLLDQLIADRSSFTSGIETHDPDVIDLSSKRSYRDVLATLERIARQTMPSDGRTDT
jgi:hypothetical protein